MNNPDWSKERVIDFNTFKCRCSAISKIMSNSRSNPVLTELQKGRLKELEDKGVWTPKQVIELSELRVKEANGKKVILSDTAIDYLMAWYSWEVHGRIPVSKESLELLSMKKGKTGEAEAIALLSMIDGEDYKQHKFRIENDYLSGELDTYLGEHIYAAKRVVDIKNSWDEPIYLKKINTDVENGHTEQVQGYGDITGAQELYVAECLVSASQEILDDMAWKVLRKVNGATFESPEFTEEWPKWVRSMTFDDMPATQRVFKKKIEPFTEFERQKLYDRVKVCREWLFMFHERFVNLNKSVSLMQSESI